MEKRRSTIDEFLRTGSLRGITEGTSVHEIGKEIGPPTHWGGDNWELNIPMCWYYQDVEIQFLPESTPIVSQLTINGYGYPKKLFKSSKLIRNVDCEPYPWMTLDKFLSYAETFEHSLSEYRWSFQDEVERVFTLNDRSWVSFRQHDHDGDYDGFFPEYDDSVEFQLVRIGTPLEGLWEFYKDPRSRYFAEHQARLEKAGDV